MDNAIDIIDAKLAQAALLVGKRYLAFLDDPDDPEANHRLRVSIRTLRSLLGFASPWKRRKPRKRAQADLKRVVGETSRLRELDVLCALAAGRGAPAGLAAACGAEAAAERARTLAALCSDDVVGALERALGACRAMPWKGRVEEGGLDGRDVRARFDAMTEDLRRDLAGLDEGDYGAVHEARKRAKQARYVAERLSPVLGEPAAATAKDMKAAQDRLGALCDAKVNREIIDGFLARGVLSPELAGALRALA